MHRGRKGTVIAVCIFIVLAAAVVYLVITSPPPSFQQPRPDPVEHSISGTVDYEKDLGKLRLRLFAGEGDSWRELGSPTTPMTDGAYVIPLTKTLWYEAAGKELRLCAVKEKDAETPFGELEPLGTCPFTIPAPPVFSGVEFDDWNGKITGAVQNDFTAGAYKVLLFGQNGAGWFPLAPPTELTGRSFSVTLSRVDWITAAEKDYALFLVEAEDAVDSYDQVLYQVASHTGTVPRPSNPRIEEYGYNESTFHVYGHVADLPYPEDYRIVLAIHVDGKLWLKPTNGDAFSRIDAGGDFYIQAYSEYPPEAMESDKRARAYTLFLVPAALEGEANPDIYAVEQASVHTVSGSRDIPEPLPGPEPEQQPSEQEQQPSEQEQQPPPQEAAPVTAPPPPANTAEPAFDTSTLSYNSDNTVSGVCTGDVSGCSVILYINVGGQWWIKPTAAEYLNGIDGATGAFRIKAYSDWPPDAKAGDLTATTFRLYLVEGAPAAGLNGYSGDYFDVAEFSR